MISHVKFERVYIIRWAVIYADFHEINLILGDAQKLPKLLGVQLVPCVNDKQAIRDGISGIVRNDLSGKGEKSKKLQGGVKWWRRIFLTYFKTNVGVLVCFFFNIAILLDFIKSK